MERRVLIGLGSNLGKRRLNLQLAVQEVSKLPGLKLAAVSSLYESSPVGGPAQGNYLNACALIVTDKDGLLLLRELQRIESELGRVREERFGPRTLDLDILLIEGERHDSDVLNVPHPRMQDRRFVLIPAQEIAADMDLGEGPATLGSLPLPKDPEQQIQKIEAPTWSSLTADPMPILKPMPKPCELIEDLVQLRSLIAAARAEGKTIGLVPTMGALHEGHASLVRKARSECDLVVASIFVNPKQFAEGEDLDSYPRTLDSDMAILSREGCDVLWHPTVPTMYPNGYCTRVEMDGLTEVLCGASRQTHFGGVLTVVLKLFNQVAPDCGYFGQKDFQQTVVLQRMVKDLNVPVKVVVCPIVREDDGLALSSRNRYLSDAERAEAPALNRALLTMQKEFQSGARSVTTLENVGRKIVAQAPLFELDYLEIRDPDNLERRTDLASAGDLVALAAKIGPARLIDNLLLR